MQRYMKMVLLSVMILSIIVLPTYASESNIKVFFDFTTQCIVIKGDNVKETLNVQVIKPNKQVPQEQLTTEQYLDIFEHTINIVPDESGNISTYLQILGDSGEYTVRINSNSFASILESKIMVASKQELKNILKIINTATSANDVKTKILDNITYRKALGIDNKLFTQVNQDTVSEFLYSKKNVDENYIDNICDDVLKISFLNYINQGSNEGSQVLFQTYKDIFNFPNSVMNSYERCIKGENKKFELSFGERISKKSYNTFADFEKQLEENIILANVESPLSRSEIENVIQEHRDKLSQIKYDTYLSLQESQKSTVLQAVAYNSYKDLSAFIVAFTNAYPSENGGGGSGSSGGTGGGGFVPSNGGQTQVKTEVPKEKEIFSDLQNYEWAKEAILNLNSKGIISGYGNAEFKPSNFVTREEFTKMVVMLLTDKKDGEEIHFNDVNADFWAYDYIKTGYNHGIVNGITKDTFGVGSNISRQDSAVILFRASSVNGKKLTLGELTFSDKNDISDYAKDAVGALSNAKIINGMSNGTFAAKDNLTRAQAAVIINNFLN